MRRPVNSRSKFASSERNFSRSNMGRTTKRARNYDNTDASSLNNPFADPDMDRYAIEAPDAFFEEVQEGREWMDDVEKGYDPESHALLPLEKTAQAKAARKMAYKKAAACIKVAEQMFPEATEEFINEQAADLYHLPNTVIASTLVRVATYQAEPAKVAAYMAAEQKKAKGAAAPKADAQTMKLAEALKLVKAYGASLAKKATTSKKAEDESEEAASDESLSLVEQIEDIQDAIDDVQTGLEDMVEDTEELADALGAFSDDVEDMDVDDMDAELADMDAEMADVDADDEEIDMSEDDDVEDMGDDEGDSKLASIFMDDENQPTVARKAASKKKDSTNLKLSTLMGSKVANKSKAGTQLDMLWDTDPDVLDAFRH